MTDDNDEAFDFNFMGQGLPDATGMAAAGMAMHELYLSLTSAGFNADQAMQILLEILRSQLAGGGEAPPL